VSAPGIAAALADRRRSPDAVLNHVPVSGDVIVGLGNGAPATVLDAIETGAGQLRDVRLHQMLPLRDRAYINGAVPGLRHVSWFLSPHDKDAFHQGKCDLVPNSFSDVPRLMHTCTGCSLVIAAVSPPDRHGYFSLGCHAEYAASMIGQVPFFVEVNRRMPRTFGENQLHVSEIVGWCEADYGLVELPSREPRDADRRIAELVAERILDGARSRRGSGRSRTWSWGCSPTTATSACTPSCSATASSAWSSPGR
jgi:acyl-CoA hydrolase